MDVNKNSYTFAFAAIMVVIVAALLSFASTALKPTQKLNVELEKKQNILSSMGVDVSREEADEAYSKYIKKELVVNHGKLKDGVDAFNIDLAKEIKKSPEDRDAPLYVAEKDGKSYYIIPLRGKGLWGPIWGYIALKGDVNTVSGAVFDHKTETPGLGAEIASPFFMDQFVDKKILNSENDFVSIQVRKGDASGDYQVDGISGGTITSTGVQTMLKDCISAYFPFLETYSKEQGANTAQADQNTENEKIATIEK